MHSKHMALFHICTFAFLVPLSSGDRCAEHPQDCEQLGLLQHGVKESISLNDRTSFKVSSVGDTESDSIPDSAAWMAMHDELVELDVKREHPVKAALHAALQSCGVVTVPYIGETFDFLPELTLGGLTLNAQTEGDK